MQTTFSQCGEDIIVQHALANVVGKAAPGFYIDVGAFHPTIYSNTALLYAQGWRGLNIDADPGAIELFRKERPRDISICRGVSDSVSSRDFFVFAGGAASTFDPGIRDTWLGLGWTLVETRKVEAAPLSTILEPYLSTIPEVDYLNIDIEGLDQVALSGFDFQRWRPAVVTIEIHGFDIMRAGDHPIVRKLTDLGYRFFSYAIVTAIFVRG